ncbi:ALP1-like protein [Tanacetum coccineum]|uniref:ALP1-like protein n=1 Tax=Tanacetum coccineum TaxID=301880 RepID=A0ABQ5IJX7_9ASTR
MLIQQEAQPRLTRTPIFRDREDAERRLRADYFDDHLIDCMHRNGKLVSSVMASSIRRGDKKYPYYNLGTTTPTRLMIFANDEHTARDAFSFSLICASIEFVYQTSLRKPTSEDVVKIQQKHNNVHGFSGMLESIDCMHWEWKNCPVSWQGQYG